MIWALEQNWYKIQRVPHIIIINRIWLKYNKTKKCTKKIQAIKNNLSIAFWKNRQDWISQSSLVMNSKYLKKKKILFNFK